MDMQEAIHLALEGDCVLFLGAGFPWGCSDVSGNLLPTGAQLASELAAALIDFPDDVAEIRDNLPELADLYLERLGAPRLVEFVRTRFAVSAVEDAHRQIAQVPWRRVYTTNFDDAFEIASRQVQQPTLAFAGSVDLRGLPANSRACIHLHGRIDDTTTSDSVVDQIRLTQRAYAGASVSDKPLSALFRRDMRHARAVFFLGYSLGDLDIERIISELDGTSERTFFIVGPNPTRLTVRKCERLGLVHRISTAEFAARVREARSEHDQMPRPTPAWLSLHPWPRPRPEAAEPTDDDFVRLLLYGDSNPDLIYHDTSATPTHLFPRTASRRAFEALQAGARFVVLSGELGNGKTVTSELLSASLTLAGWQVFWVNDTDEESLREIDALGDIQADVLLVIDGYRSWMGNLTGVLEGLPSHVRVLLTERNAVHDARAEVLGEILGRFGDVHESSVDQLDDGEIDSISTRLAHFGLWGKRSAQGRAQRVRFITNDCDRQLHLVLLNVLDSPTIRDRLRLVAAALRRNTATSNTIVALLIFRVLALNISPGMLADVWDGRALSGARLKDTPELKALVRVERGKFSLRSPLTARYLLKETGDGKRLGGLMLTLVRTFHDLRNISSLHWDVYIALLKFSTLQKVFPPEQQLASCIRFYEGAKGLRKARTDFLFWLQYAIAMLFHGDLDRAGRYFEAAYAFAKKNEKDTFQIDNHFARYQLELAVFSDDPDAAYRHYVRARHHVILELRRTGQLHYPYRVAASIGDVWQRHASEMSDSQRKDMFNIAKEILTRIQHLDSRLRTHPDVLRCELSLTPIMISADPAASKQSATPSS